MRIGIAAALAISLLATPVFAADQDQGALAPGGAAGVQQAQDIDLPIIISVVGITAVAVAVTVLVSNDHHSSATTTSAAP
jgi:heme/copper-type cytochrome/quinol oxidase subunit 2